MEDRSFLVSLLRRSSYLLPWFAPRVCIYAAVAVHHSVSYLLQGNNMTQTPTSANVHPMKDIGDWFVHLQTYLITTCICYLHLTRYYLHVWNRNNAEASFVQVCAGLNKAFFSNWWLFCQLVLRGSKVLCCVSEERSACVQCGIGQDSKRNNKLRSTHEWQLQYQSRRAC